MRIVLLHGLARSGRSMAPIERALARAGHDARTLRYRSRHAPLRHLAAEVADGLLALGWAAGGPDVGFVTHSMGGLVLRALARVLPGFRCGRSVLVACPLRGSILAERLASHAPARAFFGPALEDLSARAVEGLPPVPGPFGVIAGNTWSPLGPGAWFVRAWAPGRPSDSTVLLDETQSGDAADHVVVPGVHGLLPASPIVARQAAAFLATGAFERPTAGEPANRRRS